jgi:hypothetical protein
MKKYNVFGFDRRESKDWGAYRHCTIHQGARLIPSIDFPDMLLCPKCGTHYPSNLTSADVNIASKFTPINQKVRQRILFTGRAKTRTRYDDFGNIINPNDVDAMNDIKEGRKIRYYNEKKAGKYSY